MNDTKYLKIEHKNKTSYKILEKLDDGKEEQNKHSTIISRKTLGVEILKIFNSKKIYHWTVLTRINRNMSIDEIRKT